MFAIEEMERDWRLSVSPTHREDFYREKAELLSWFTRWNRVLDCSDPEHPKWFCGGTLNLCYNALDRHVLAGTGDRVALVYDSPRTREVTHLTYTHLLEKTCLVAGVLHDQCGITKGDSVIIFMPKVLETAVALLACARLGALACTVYGGLPPSELAKRIDHCQAKVVISVSGGLVAGKIFDFKSSLDKAVVSCRSPPAQCLILVRPGMGTQKLCGERDLSWNQVVPSALPFRECVPMEASEPLHLLYTSGTTGEPKGVLLPSCYCISFLYCPSYYTRPPAGRHVFLTTSEFGWVLAQYYTVVVPLITGQSSVIFEGVEGLNGSSSHWPRLVNQHRVTIAISGNSPFRQLRQQDPNCAFREKFNCSSLSLVLLGGECADEELLDWVTKAFSCYACDVYGQTEVMHVTGILQPCALDTDIRHFSSSWPNIGHDVKVLDEKGEPAQPGAVGRICIKPPLRPGSLLTIYKNDAYFLKQYFQSYPGYYDTKDSGRLLSTGQLNLCGRDDDVIIVDGTRINGNDIEQELRRVDGVLDCAVVPGPNPQHWEEPVAFLVLENRRKSDFGIS